MGIFDRLRRVWRGDDALADRRRRLPPGFKVEVWAGTIDVPSFTLMEGGVWLVSTGPATDMNLETLRSLFSSMREALARPVATVHLAADAARLDELVRPAPPPVAELPRVAVWTLQDGTLDGWTRDAPQVAEVLRGFELLAPDTRHVVLATRADLDDAPWLFRLMRGLDVEVRELPEDGKVLVEVQRPDGQLVSAVRGRRQELRALDRRDLAQLIGRARPPRAPRPLHHAPRLRQLIGGVVDGGLDARAELCRYLLARATPLLMPVTSSAAEHVRAELYTDEHGASAVDLLPDLDSVQRLTGGTAERIASKPPAEALTWARDLGLGLALKIVRGEDVVRAVLSLDTVRGLVAGQLPAA